MNLNFISVDPHLYSKMYEEASPFFKYANSKNPSRVIRQWTSILGPRTELVYLNCIACNVQKFSNEEFLYFLSNGYFCKTCLPKATELKAKYIANPCQKEKILFLTLWNNSLYGEIPSAKL